MTRYAILLPLTLAIGISACQAPLEATNSTATVAQKPASNKGGGVTMQEWRTPVSTALLTGYVRDGGLRADVVVMGGQVRFDQRAQAWVAASRGQGRLMPAADGRYNYTAPDGTRFIFAPVATGMTAMTQSAIGGQPSFAHIVEARFADGETWQWRYEAQEARTNCGVKGRFGLTNPDCQIRYYSRPIEIISSHGLRVKPVYASAVLGEEYNRVTGIGLYDASRCNDGLFCRDARLISSVPAAGSTALPAR